jgi:BioD-like phosphotransacetylase family protein
VEKQRQAHILVAGETEEGIEEGFVIQTMSLKEE